MAAYIFDRSLSFSINPLVLAIAIHLGCVAHEKRIGKSALASMIASSKRNRRREKFISIHLKNNIHPFQIYTILYSHSHSQRRKSVSENFSTNYWDKQSVNIVFCVRHRFYVGYLFVSLLWSQFYYEFHTINESNASMNNWNGCVSVCFSASWFV